MAAKFSKKDLEEFTAECVVKKAIHDPEDIVRKAIEKFEFPKGAGRKILPIISATVKAVSEKQIYELMIAMMMDGTKDFRTLSSAAMGEGYDVNQAQISNIIQNVKRNLCNEMSQAAKEKMLTRGKVEANTMEKDESGLMRVEDYQQKLMDTIEGSFYDNKEKFLAGLEKQVSLQLSRRIKKGDNSINIFQGEYKGKQIFLKCTLNSQLEVVAANLFFGRIVEGKIKGINLTLSQLKDKWSGDKGFDECLKDIRKIHDFLGFNDFLQTVWFLSNFQRYAVNLPSSLENYITEYLTRFTVKAEEIKSKEAISNLVKHKYHSFIDNGQKK